MRGGMAAQEPHPPMLLVVSENGWQEKHPCPLTVVKVYVSPARSESAGCWVNEVMVAWLEIPPLITYAAPLCSMHMLVVEDVQPDGAIVID
jgi:hypothetical protein